MARYRRVSLMTREALNRMVAEGSSLRVIGQALSRVPSIVSRVSGLLKCASGLICGSGIISEA